MWLHCGSIPVDRIATKDLKYSVNNSLQDIYINELSIKMQPISFRLIGPAHASWESYHIWSMSSSQSPHIPAPNEVFWSPSREELPSRCTSADPFYLLSGTDNYSSVTVSYHKFWETPTAVLTCSSKDPSTPPSLILPDAIGPSQEENIIGSVESSGATSRTFADMHCMHWLLCLAVSFSSQGAMAQGLPETLVYFVSGKYCCQG